MKHASPQHARYWSLIILAGLTMSSLGLAQDGKAKTPTRSPSTGVPLVSSAPITPQVGTALEELLERLRAHLREAGQVADVRCDAPRVWAYPGTVEAAAAWIGRQVRRLGFAFSSEGQLAHSYAFTAVTNDPKHVSDVMVGGLIESGPAVMAFLERCHPGDS